MHTVYPATTLDVTITYPSTDYPVPTYTTGTTAEQADGWAFFSSPVILHMPDWSNGSGRPGIIVCHGANQSAWSLLQPGEGRMGDYTRALADAGFVVVGMNLGDRFQGNNLSLRAVDLAYTYLTGITGGTKVGLISASSGALTALAWAKKFPAKVGGIFMFNPLTDIEAVRGAPWWNTPYEVLPGDPNAAFNYDSGVDPAGSNGAYKVTDDAGFFTNAVDQGHAPNRSPEDWAGYNIVVAHAQMDNVVPYQMSQWWVSAVNSPTVQLRLVTTASGTHNPSSMLADSTTDTATLAAGGLARQEVTDFFHTVL